jgi:hypothetical protein
MLVRTPTRLEALALLLTLLLTGLPSGVYTDAFRVNGWFSSRLSLSVMSPSWLPLGPAAPAGLSSTHVSGTGGKVFIRASQNEKLSSANSAEVGLFSNCADGDGRTANGGLWVSMLNSDGWKSSTLDRRMPIWTVAEDSIDDSLLCPLPSQGFTTGGGLNESLVGVVIKDE